MQENTTAEEWQFLTTEQALEDVVYFASRFTLAYSVLGSQPTTNPVHPSLAPWIWLGGSYPGIRGALLRIRNPETIYAVWASSAPVEAQVDMSSYYKAAERSLTRNCSADWVVVTKHVDDVLQNGTTEQQTDMKYRLLKARADGPGGNISGSAGLTRSIAANTSNVAAAGVLMDPLRFYQVRTWSLYEARLRVRINASQYYGFQASVLPFCDLLETQNYTETPFEGGVVSAYGVDRALQAFLTAIAELNYDAIEGDPDDPVQDRSWMWQYCSEYGMYISTRISFKNAIDCLHSAGFYQRGDPNNPLSIETSFRSLDYFQDNCNAAFPHGLPPSPNVSNVNKYGGWNMSPSNVLFTNGECEY